VALTLLVYSFALTNAFVYDDVQLILVNPLLRDLGGLRTLLTEARMTSQPIWQGHYRPVLMLGFWLNYQLGGTAPFAWRLVNLLIHVGDGLLAFVLVRRVARRLDARYADATALAAAALFLLHPLQAITVDLVLKRNSSLSTLFMLLALLGFARALERRRELPYVGALVAGSLAMLTKEDALALPALLALVAAVEHGRVPWARIAPFVVVPLGFVLFGAHALGGGALGYLLAQPIAVARYLRMLVDPGAIAACYDLEPGVSVGRALGLLVAAAGVGAIVALRRRAPLAALATAWAVIAFAPSSSLVAIDPTMDEVRCHLAFLFVYALAGAGLARLLARLRPLIAAAAIVVVFGLPAAATAMTNDRWRHPLELWLHAVERYPQSRIANRALCEELNRTQAAEAVMVCRRAVALWPADVFARYDLVSAYAGAGRFDDAAAVVREALATFPRAPLLWKAAGHLAWMRDDFAAAEAAYRRVLAELPDDDSARVHLADVLLARGDRAGAAALVQSFAGAPPGDPGDRQLLATVSEKLRAEAR
jgi:hypothetical protein